MALSLKYQVSLCLNQSLYPLLPDFESSGIRIINIPIERKLSPLSDLRALKSLLVIFKREKFSSVHTFTPKAGLIGMLAAFLCAVPNRLHTFTGQVWVNEGGFKRWFYKNIDRIIVLFSTQVFCDSASQGKFLIREGVCQSKKISMLGFGSISGVNLDRFKSDPLTREGLRRKFSISEDVCLFLYLGRLSKDKGIYDLLRAFADLRKKCGDIALWIVGPDEEGIAKSIKSHDSETYSSINWFGLSFNPEIYMASADVLLLPSYREGFGTVIIEAAACSLPTVAYKIDGVVDAIVNGQTGLLVRKGDVRDFRNKMEFLYRNTRLRLKLGSSAKKRVDENFSGEIVTKAWLDFYHQLVSTEINQKE